MKRVRKTKEDTSKEIWTIIHQLENDSIDLTVKNVCEFGKISRTTLYKYPEIKNYITSKDETELIKKLNFENNKLKKEILELKSYIQIVEEERNIALINQFKNKQLRNINE